MLFTGGQCRKPLSGAHFSEHEGNAYCEVCICWFSEEKHERNLENDSSKESGEKHFLVLYCVAFPLRLFVVFLCCLFVL